MLAQMAELDTTKLDMNMSGLDLASESLNPDLVLDSMHSTLMPSGGSGQQQLLLDSLLTDPTTQTGTMSNLLSQGPDLLLGLDLEQVCSVPT